MKIHLLLAAFLLAAFVPACARAGGAPDKCTALREGYFLKVSAFTSWQQVSDAFLCLPPGADDGAPAEAFSDRVGWLLAYRWESIGALQDLFVRDPAFSQFVVRHIDLTIPADQLETIRANATERCPAASAALCHSLLSAVARVDAEAAEEASQ